MRRSLRSTLEADGRRVFTLSREADGHLAFGVGVVDGLADHRDTVHREPVGGLAGLGDPREARVRLAAVAKPTRAHALGDLRPDGLHVLTGVGVGLFHEALELGDGLFVGAVLRPQAGDLLQDGSEEFFETGALGHARTLAQGNGPIVG